MAATIKGRKGCPFCGFGAAHVKQTEGKHPYLHCPECGVMTHAKSGAQARLIVAGMRPEGQQQQAAEPAQAPAAAPAAKPAEPAKNNTPEKAPKPASWLDSLGL